MYTKGFGITRNETDEREFNFEIVSTSRLLVLSYSMPSFRAKYKKMIKLVNSEV